MKELNPTIDNLNAAALDAALRSALPGKVFGVSSYGSSRPVSIWLDDAATPSDETTALALAAAHDPVFVSIDKTTFQANGTDAATISVAAPNPGSAPVSLLVGGTSVPVSLSGGLGSITLTSADPVQLTVGVQNSENRFVGQFVIEAI
jgi:hypothetical protein